MTGVSGVALKFIPSSVFVTAKESDIVADTAYITSGRGAILQSKSAGVQHLPVRHTCILHMYCSYTISRGIFSI